MGVFALATRQQGTVANQLGGVHRFGASTLWRLEAGRRIHALGSISPIILFSSGSWKLESGLAVGGLH